MSKDHFLDNMNDDTLERMKTQASGLKWLYEMEVLNSPQLINNLKLNIFTQDNTIRDVELLFDQNNKGVLIYIKLSWWGRTFRQKEIKIRIEDIITQLLPSYRKRVITERWILDLALTKAKEVVGVKNEKSSKKPNTTDSNGSDTDVSRSSGDELQETSDLLPDQEEQKVDEQKDGNEVEQPDLQSEPKVQDPS
tara:strand:+ start:81039 stop:81620 length:582 start_codon:yes stop_codon:yes gene_type:complete